MHSCSSVLQSSPELNILSKVLISGLESNCTAAVVLFECYQCLLNITSSNVTGTDFDTNGRLAVFIRFERLDFI